MLDKLSKLVTWDDPATGRVRPRREVEAVDILDAEMESAKTRRTPKTMPAPGSGSDPGGVP
jgi:hypothetical protein